MVDCYATPKSYSSELLANWYGCRHSPEDIGHYSSWGTEFGHNSYQLAFSSSEAALTFSISADSRWSLGGFICWLLK